MAEKGSTESASTYCCVHNCTQCTFSQASLCSKDDLQHIEDIFLFLHPYARAITIIWYIILYDALHNNNTQKAALAKLPLTTHPHERAEPHTFQTQFTPACTTWPSPLPCETPDLPDLPTLPPTLTLATGPRSPAEDWC